MQKSEQRKRKLPKRAMPKGKEWSLTTLFYVNFQGVLLKKNTPYYTVYYNNTDFLFQAIKYYIFITFLLFLIRLT